MSFSPNYTITDLLLANIKRISELVTALNNQRFPKVVTFELERIAREVSSFASTSIEGNPLPLTEVKKILKSRPENLRDSEREVINYNQALKYLDMLVKNQKAELSLDLVLEIHRKVIEGLLPDFETGSLRRHPVVVNDPKSREVVFLPPDVSDVEPLILDLISFVQEKKQLIDPLILAGIFHKQMVVIHPFMDGNGRTTRLITKLLLAAMGLNTFNLFSFENYYNSNVTKYFQVVGEFGNYYEIVEKIDFSIWLEYFTGGIIDELLRVSKILPSYAVNPQTQLQGFHMKIMKYIQEHGFITDSDYEKLTDRSKATRALDFQKLIELGMVERKGKARATYYVLKQS
jgi:Fic family protein